MKKKNLKKLLMAVCCAALLVCVSIGATVAYLTSKDEVTNTFTVGNVQITLDEAQVNANGKPIKKDGTEVEKPEDAERVKENNYKLLPGHSYTKDPTVTVKANSESAYVRMLVTVSFGKTVTQEDLPHSLSGIVTGYSDVWTRNGDPTITNEDNKTVVKYEYRLWNGGYTYVDNNKDKDVKLPALFTGITIPENWTNDYLNNTLGGFTVKIVAQAIQKDGFTDEDTAWSAFPTN